MKNELDQSPKKKNIWATLARTLISLALLTVLFANFDLTVFQQVFEKLSLTLLIGLPLAFGLNILFSTLRWQMFLKDLNVKEGLGVLFLIYFISYFWGNFLPTTIGGDGYRFLEMRAKHQGKESEILLSLFLDRAYGFLFLLILHIFATFYFLSEIRLVPFLFWAEIGIILGPLSLMTIWRQRHVFDQFTWSKSKPIENIFVKIRKILELSRNQSWQTIFFSSVMSILFVAVSGWAWVICYMAAGAEVNSLFVFYVSTLSSILGVLPVSINGLGLVEMSQTIAMGTQGIGVEMVLVAAISARVAGLLISAVGGIAYLVKSWLSTLAKIGTS